MPAKPWGVGRHGPEGWTLPLAGDRGELPKPVPADGEVLVKALRRRSIPVTAGRGRCASRAGREFDFGCHAEYVTVAERGAIARIPENRSYQDAVALCFGGTTSLNFVRLGKLAPGEAVLINGPVRSAPWPCNSPSTSVRR